MTELTDAVNALNARLQVHLAGLDRPVLVTEGAPAGDEGVEGVYALDVDGLAFYGPKTGSSWGAPRVFGGVDGREIELRVTATHIQQRYVGETSWTDLIALSALQGDDGAAGWTPVFALEADSARRVLRITDWTGGTGTKPATGYLSSGGLVSTAAAATDIRGPAGAPGAGTGDLLAANNLSDLASAATARTNLDVYSKSESDGRYPAAGALNELIDDRVAALLVAGANITLTYNDATGQLTIAASGGGGGGGDTAALFDDQLFRMRQDMGSAPLDRPYGFADPLATNGRINTAGSSGAYFATGHAQNQPTSGDGATPTVVDTGSLAVGTAATTHTLTDLAGGQTGDYVIALVAQDGTGTATATYGGQAMTELGTQSNSSVRLTVFGRERSGAESGENVVVTTSASTTCAIQAYLVRGRQGAPQVAFDTTLFDPPSLTASWGSTNNLWLAVTAHEADRNFLGLLNYTNALVTRAGATGDFSGALCSLGSARWARVAATEDPGAWSMQGVFAGNTASATIVFRPGPPAAEAMDLRWTGYDLPANPTRLNMQCQIEVLAGTLTLGTTLRGWLSRDGGTTYTEATLTVRSQSGATYVLNALGVDVSGQPAGDDAAPRLTATSALTVRVLDMAVLAGG